MSDRRNELIQQFAPKYKRDKLKAKLKREGIMKKLESKIPRDECHECGERYETVCKCMKLESKCPNGHEWYFCFEHGIRVNLKYDSSKPCGDHEGKIPE